MTDSPAVGGVFDPKEQPILDRLLAIRDQLSLLKQDKSTYIRSSDVVPLYDQIIEQVVSLNGLRTEKRQEQNRVDKVLDDCFQLISLFFMTVGRNNEAPAVYATTSTIKRLLDHLTEAKLYCDKDLESISSTMEDIKAIVRKGKERYSPHLLTLLEARIKTCEDILKERHNEIAGISLELRPIHEKMISILRSISAANTKQTFSAKEVKDFQKQLQEMNDAKVDGYFIGRDVGNEDGQQLLSTLLQRCLMWSNIVLERQGKIEEGFRNTYDELRDIRNQLSKLTLTQAWSLRETDLYGFQRKLDKIDEARDNQDFIDVHGKKADLYHQRTLLYLLRRSYAYIYSLIVSSEPVSEALLPVYNQLQTLRRCLLEVKRSGGVSSPRELYPYSMKLNSIDNMRVDGRFVVGSEFPEGQGSVISLLEECFELNYELRVAAESEEDESREEAGPAGAEKASGEAQVVAEEPTVAG